ncbi:Chitinase 2 [Tieghemiomyces parasiticus]|uniref:chitinase n=1 Tax=Tieghemiomyces parasiticus TaxID=78921 RepID=A0A9W8DUV0_9FUNG|nr:Chitinase 2 [Tieghemiomyces parasiticus]
MLFGKSLTAFAAGLALTTVNLVSVATAFDLKCNNNLVHYWGQNSYGASHPNDAANWEKPLADYCKDDTSDAFVLSFLHIFNAGKDQLPGTNFANHCNTTFPGSELHQCPDIAKDITYCQGRGKKVLLSLGGAAGSYGFQNDQDAAKFSQTIWNLFLGGTSNTRPFGDVRLDGVDLDIEGGGTVGYSTFVTELRKLYKSDTKKQYLVAAAPQCPYPDAYMGPVMNTAHLDMVFVQFYNNFCGVNNYPQFFNFNEWQTWADSISVNKDVKVFLGVPGSSTAAGNGYIDSARLATIIQETRAKYSAFGGAMVWDASQGYNNMGEGLATSYSAKLKAALNQGQKCGGQDSTPTSSKHEPEPTSSPSTSIDKTTSPSSTATTENPEESSPDMSSPVPSTSTSASPSTPSGNDNCVVADSPCGTEGAFHCNGYDFAQCVHGKWLVRSCSADESMACFSTSSGGVYCDTPQDRPITSCPASALVALVQCDSDALTTSQAANDALTVGGLSDSLVAVNDLLSSVTGRPQRVNNLNTHGAVPAIDATFELTHADKATQKYRLQVTLHVASPVPLSATGWAFGFNLTPGQSLERATVDTSAAPMTAPLNLSVAGQSILGAAAAGAGELTVLVSAYPQLGDSHVLLSPTLVMNAASLHSGSGKAPSFMALRFIVEGSYKADASPLLPDPASLTFVTV